MSGAQLESPGAGRFRVAGTLDANTVADVLAQSIARFGETPDVDLHIDLDGVTHADSAGLALLIEWLRIARQQRRAIHFSNVPPQINALARISEVEDLLTANETAPAQVAASASA